MQCEDQSDVIAFLTSPATHAGLRGPITSIQTHISVVVLADDRVYKLKRAVRLSYLDFSTPERRLAACGRELELNRRTAPSIYRTVRRITRQGDGGLAFDGGGALVDAVVEMNRFDESTLFDAMAQRRQLTPALLTELAGSIARSHATAPIVHGAGGASRITAVLDLNRRALDEVGLFDRDALADYDARVTQSFQAALWRLDQRAQAGKVRHCHGDLHLRNICLVDGVPTLFDCIEFDDGLATIDVLYDLAFVLMDLWHRDLAAEANLLSNRYLDQCDETDGLPLLPLFMSMRAAVRAHVVAADARSRDGTPAEAGMAAARSYLDLARSLLTPAPACLVAIGGFSGTGKSTVASAISPRLGKPPGARVLSSDRIRKAMFAVLAQTRLPPQAYDAEVSALVYARVAEEARRVVAGGTAVIVESVFDRAPDRARIARQAHDAGVPFTGVWLEAPIDTLLTRVAARQGDPSDATVDVVRAQLARDVAAIDWRRVNSAGPIAIVSGDVLDCIAGRLAASDGSLHGGA